MDKFVKPEVSYLLEPYFSDNHYNLALQEQAGRNILWPAKEGV